jgi:hypothetical protein
MAQSGPVPTDTWGPFLGVLLSFPAAVYTVLLAFILLYWVFVMIGAAHVNLLGDGAVEGGAKGVLEHGADAFDTDVDVEGSGVAGIIAALKLRSAPATVVLSLIVLFAWIVTVLGAQASEAILGHVPMPVAALLFVIAPLVALVPTSILVRPLARIFTPHGATKHEALVGKVCTIRTGTVTDRFGEATLEDGGAGVVVRVRVDAGEQLGRGEQAVIVAYDAEREEFTVAPMRDVLGDGDRIR